MDKSKKSIGIKGKVLLGCIVLAIVLFISSVISMFEFSGMNDYVSGVISDNIGNINASRDLLSAAEKHNLRLQYGLNGDFADIEESDDHLFIRTFAQLQNTFTDPLEKEAAQAVVYSYAAYMQVVREAPAKWEEGIFVRRDWYYGRLQPIYIKLRENIQHLNFVCQDALIENSRSLQDNYYRSMMPQMVSFLIGLMLVMLFNYYLNYYLINPLLKINKGIKAYRRFNKPYDVQVEGNDELSDLNGTVSDIIDLNKSYKAHIGQLKDKYEKQS